ncbi:DUF4065 domain-containing protein [Corynebacterium sp. 320]|uniref:Panacea domain-containing protein n=1 Tax=Corynebacterium TaxID=1716 RepID=UPI00125CD1B5|nr:MULTISPECIES: type II toxin-antitoxin system antitoxin SocA domain-containing protein [Corynebacterium]KAB1504360.1 DUF4065 domain-containing protein [Corynebacterium sp. 320]KAB1552542.1 DUF4065 domain-containing protein [Corynebacterium sp. 321]KAB1554241.1 DUF4065 domain-containing protein [Corynebacterium sp. 319]KAB3528496.1 DUF4065 domain-containing protein [Corynebacterium sp. 250]KAB3540015.1 DUF4065 domain-containing protein [Corynebacterium sp. 366]
MACVNDVARYILEHVEGRVSTMKLQKLVYYAQAWHLVWDEQPLFDSRIEAWANGPVVRELYVQHRGEFTARRELFPGDSGRLTNDEKESIDAVLKAYGRLNGQQLSDLSHSERPWREARKGIEEGDSCTNEVSREVMQDFYSAMRSASTA